MSQIRSAIVEEIDAFLLETGISEDRFGRAAVGDHRFLENLRAGSGVTLTRIESAEAFMRAELSQRADAAA